MGRPVSEDWEKEFDDKFSSEWWNGFGTTEDINKLGIDSIKDFIRSHLTSAIADIEGMKRDGAYSNISNQALSAAVEVLKSKMK